jgi:PAS domain S-box-containing protein
MKEKRNIRIFYVSTLLLGVTAIIHELYDPPVTPADWISHIAFLGAVVFMVAMTVFIFRPHLRVIAQFQSRAALWETVIKGANDGIIITEADLGLPGPHVVYVNEAFTQISGYSAEEIVGKSPRILQNEFTKRETLDEMKRALSEGKPFKGELLNVHKNGKNYWLDISIVPIKNAAGVVTHFAAIERDITEKKEKDNKEKDVWVQLKRANMKAEVATRELQESLKKAEAANIAKGDFLANMSHELRTPMNGVLGMASLLSETALNEEQREYVSTINSSGESLLMLLNDILDFSKIEAGALELENIAYHFPDTIMQTANLLRPQVEKKGIDLYVDCDANVPAYIWGDSGRLRQIIMNLMGNAIKFTEQGHVRLHAGMQEHADGNRLYVRVEDTGMGIPANKLGEIFEKFTQADASITRKYGGTGLGLAITKQLVSLMGGELGVESAEGKGSTFWLAIPCNPAEASDEMATIEHLRTISQQPAPHLPIHEACALLVDDYHVNRVFAEKLLRKFGFKRIDTAEDGVDALLKCNEQAYDIIFMDCQMPRMDGYITTHEIRSLEASGLNHMPIVAMTANAMVGDREKCLNAGMDDYLSKPLRAEHLKKILQTWFVLAEENAAILAEKPVALTTNAPQEMVVDMEQLRMFTDGDREEEKALAELFLAQAQEMLTVLENSMEADQRDTWKSAAHRFKGSSGNLGAMALHQLCKRAESRFEDAPAHKQDMLADMKQQTARVAEFFASIAA